MADKPKKKSNFVGFTDENQLRKYIVDLDQDLVALYNYLDTFPRFFEQAAEPTIQRNTFSFWSDSALSKMYLLCNISGGQKKVELT